jgi:hypothetical protein
MENGHCAMVFALADDYYIYLFEQKYLLVGQCPACAEETFLTAPHCSD